MKSNQQKKKDQTLYTTIMIALVGVIVISLTLTLLKLMDSKPWEAKIVYQAAASEHVSQATSVTIPLNPFSGDSIEDTAIPYEEWTPEPTIESVGKDPNSSPSAVSTPEPAVTAESDSKSTAGATAKATTKATSKATGSSTTSDPTATPSYVANTREVDFDSLKAINSDIVAWLYLEDTIIDYPVVKTTTTHGAGFYLSHMYDLTEQRAGSLFISSPYTPFSRQNTIIQGHRMNNGTMFGTLYKYKKQSYFNQHPIFQLYTPSKNYFVYIFAAYEVDILGDYYHETFSSGNEFMEYINECMLASAISTGVTPRVTDKILTMCTCVSGNDTVRFIVQGVLVEMDNT